MLSRKKAKQKHERVDRAERNLLNAIKISDDEISAVASSPDLYDGLLMKIAAGQPGHSVAGAAADEPLASERGRRDIGSSLWALPAFRWTLTAAAILVLVALAALLLLPRQSSQSIPIQSGVPRVDPAPLAPEQAAVPSTGRDSDLAQVGNHQPEQVSTIRVSRRHHQRAGSTTEVATEFFPLTFTADSAASESGHVVRVRISRTALLAVGLPMNVARAGELITADVVIGDDGLARAIRFIQ